MRCSQDPMPRSKERAFDHLTQPGIQAEASQLEKSSREDHQSMPGTVAHAVKMGCKST